MPDDSRAEEGDQEPRLLAMEFLLVELLADFYRRNGLTSIGKDDGEIEKLMMQKLIQAKRTRGKSPGDYAGAERSLTRSGR